MEYQSVVGRCEYEKTIEKSRFISYIAHVEGEEEARAFLAEIRALHPTATHVCSAFVADKVGNELRFSDDGEPQGTAGMPILGVIRAQKLFETAVAVVRYFGGVKLGAGGLVRAYSTLASEGIGAAQKRLYSLAQELSVLVDYAQIDGTQRFFSTNAIEVLGQDYGEGVTFSVAVKEEEVALFSQKLTDWLNGRVKILQKDKYFYPFPLDNE